MPTSGPGDGSRGGASSEFEERAKRLSMRKTSVSTKHSKEVIERKAARRLEKLRPPMPIPTAVSDMEQVLDWLDRHLAPDKVKAAQRELEMAAQSTGSQMEGMLKGWMKRASRTVERRNSHEKSGSSPEGVAEGNGEASSGGGEVPGGSPTGGSGGKKSGWLGNLQGELNELDEPPAEATSSVWARQRELEVKMHAMVEKRVSERQERKRAAAARREERQRRREMSELCSESDSEEEESDSGVGAQREAHALSLAQTLKDESVAKFLSQLPELEKKKAEAKQACFSAERALREVLGRKPAEIERREDEAWGRAALAFKEADQALIICRSLCSWDD